MAALDTLAAVAALDHIRDRLEASGAWLELHQLSRMGPVELEAVVARELREGVESG